MKGVCCQPKGAVIPKATFQKTFLKFLFLLPLLLSSLLVSGEFYLQNMDSLFFTWCLLVLDYRCVLLCLAQSVFLIDVLSYIFFFLSLGHTNFTYSLKPCNLFLGLAAFPAGCSSSSKVLPLFFYLPLSLLFIYLFLRQSYSVAGLENGLCSQTSLELAAVVLRLDCKCVPKALPSSSCST